jgi:hypothetical protein
LGGDLRKIAEQTATLAKGIAKKVAGLVGNASTLVRSRTVVNRLPASVFLILIGMVLLAASMACLQIHNGFLSALK